MGILGTHSFKLCGVQYTQKSDYSIHLTQKEHVDAIKLAPARRITKSTQKQLDPSDVKILRGVQGEIQCLATNTRPDLAAGVSISAGNVNKAEITDLQHANKPVKTAKADSDIPIIFNRIPVEDVR